MRVPSPVSPARLRVPVLLAAAGAAGLLGSLACTGSIDTGAPGESADPSASPGGGATASSPRSTGPGGAAAVPSGGAAPSGGSAPLPGVAPPGGAAPASCATPQPGPAPLRRLTAREYDNTVRDLMRASSNLAAEFGGNAGKGFDNAIDGLGVDRGFAQALSTGAERVAAEFVKDLPRALGCDPASKGEDVCARSFLETFGARAWRRPLEAAELTALVGSYTRLKTKFGFASAIRLMTQYFLQSPRFVYRPEFGVPARAGEKAVRLTPWEIASRLSYLFWETAPDAALVDAAREGRLTTPEQVATQARRLLQDPQGRRTVAHFNEQWLQLAEFGALDRSRTTFPTWSTALNPLYRTEIERFVEHVIWEGKGDVATLLTAPYSFVNDKLAAFYGVPGTFTADFKKVDLDPAQRSGLLTRGGLMAVLAHRKASAPVLRGLFVRSKLLCSDPPPPPDGVDITISEADQSLPARQQLVKHQSDPACGGCHALIDNIGFGLENFDATGRWRTTEASKPVDASGEIVGTDAAGKFTGPQELGRKLAGSADAAGCVAKQWFRYAAGRSEAPEDACALGALQRAFAAGGHRISEVLIALVQTDAFLYRPVGGAP